MTATAIGARDKHAQDGRGAWTAGHAERRRPLIIAHRGAAALAPENTMAAFEAALDAGADAIETDVRLTADGIPVCLHDAVLDSADGARVAVARTSLAALCRAAPHVTLLADVASCGFATYVDLKEETPERVLALLGALDVDRCADRWIVGVAGLPLGDAIARHYPALRQVALMLDADALAAFARRRPGDWARIHEPRATVDRVAALRAQGLRVMITCGGGERPTGAIDFRGLARLAALAPDGIVLNDPALARQVWSSVGPGQGVRG